MVEICCRRYPKIGIHGRVVHELGREIVRGIIRQHEKLPNEAALISRFKSSRTALREAFRVLAAKGLLEARQRTGTIVRGKKYWNLIDPDILAWQSLESLGPDGVRSLMECRLITEPAVAKLVARSASEEQANDLGKICIAMGRAEQSGSREAVFNTKLHFHMALFEICHNDLLKRQRDVIQKILTYEFHQQNIHGNHPYGTAKNYAFIVEKIRVRNSVAAEQSFRTLIEKENSILEGFMSGLESIVA
ncbi:MAG: FCD domain-containing protein [Sneathiella sp.]